MPRDGANATKGARDDGSCPPKLRFVNEQDSLDRRVAGRKRTRNEMLTNRKRLAGLWDATPDDEPAKRGALQEWHDESRGARLERFVLPRDRVQGDSATVPRIHEPEPGSAHGVGSSKAPLAAAVLEDWRSRQPCRGIRALATESIAKGCMSCVPKGSARQSRHAVLGSKGRVVPCPQRFLPGFCRTLHGARAVAVAIQLKKLLWLWVTSRWRRMDLEGALVARFTVAEGSEERAEFHVLSRRLGNPRVTVWTHLQASHARVVLPCQLQLALREGLLIHEGDCALCHRLAGDGATQVTAAEVMVIDGADSLASFTASGIVEGSQQNLWPPHEKPDGTSWHPTPLLEKLSQAEKVRRPGCDRPKSKALQEVEGNLGLCSGSDASLGDWSDEGDEGGAASARGHAPGTRRAAEGQLRRCPPGNSRRQGVVGPPDAPAASSGDPAGCAANGRRAAASPLVRDRQEAIQRVFGVVRELRAEAAFHDTAPRAVISEALNRLDAAGRRFWGVGGLYTRRRTALDACSAAWPQDLS